PPRRRRVPADPHPPAVRRDPAREKIAARDHRRVPLLRRPTGRARDVHRPLRALARGARLHGAHTMIRAWLQISRGRTPRQAHVDLDGPKEDELGRGGFTGRVANLYRRNDPTAWSRIEGEVRLWDVALHEIAPTDVADPRGAPILAFFNQDVHISVSRRAAPMPFFVRNAD